MTDLERKRTQVDADGRRGWSVVGPLGAIEFWLFDPPVSTCECGGVEMHRRQPFSYQDDRSKHEACDVIGGDCWHDGTSLWASEHWIPNYRRLGEEFGEEWVYEELERYYTQCLQEEED